MATATLYSIYTYTYLGSSKLRKLLCGGLNTNVHNLSQDIGYN